MTREELKVYSALVAEARDALDEMQDVHERFPSLAQSLWPPTRRRYDREWDAAKERVNAALVACKIARRVFA